MTTANTSIKVEGLPPLIINPDPKALLPVLQPHVYRSRTFGHMLKHPLVVQVPLYSADMANKIYTRKVELVEGLLAKGEYDHALQIYERFCRLTMLHEWFTEGRLKLPMLRKCLRFAWTDTEDPPYEEALEMFIAAGYTSDKHRRLKGTLTLYRGDSTERYNMEWSLSRKTAEWFARRFDCKTPVLAITEIDASKALAYLTNRGEEEVIVNPADIGDVKFVRLDTIKREKSE